ncbi:hypothetical protein AFK24_07070 [Pseudomonas syringae]|uniref:Toxin n=1 Tax=Pseudomonas syringae TaxID=317 RepID=A0A1C7Z799_PSESX|nr:alpha-xenorhabdolysin family binary toxin subunit A [Pseudomonas syringae]OCR25713.1 hypothetical protein AFK24_07070 [Pseudomonas syringae]
MTPVKTEISQSLMNEITTGFINVVSSASPEVTRAPGVLATAKDIQALRRFAADANALPQRLDQVKFLLGYDKIDVPGLEPKDILNLYNDIQNTAELWPYLEINMKNVSAGLGVFADNLKSIGNDVIAQIQRFDSYSNEGVVDEYKDVPLESIPHSPLLASDEKRVSTLGSFIKELNDLLDEQKKEAADVKDRITDYKYELTGLAAKVGLKRKLCLTAASNMDSSNLNEQIESLNTRIAEEQRTYETYCRYIWVGAWWGPVGLAISGGIYGFKANDVWGGIERLISEKQQLSDKLQSGKAANALVTFETSLQDLTLRIDGAASGATNLQELWTTITTYIMSAAKRFKDTGNATLLTVLVSRLTNLISNWQEVKLKAELLQSAFDYSAEPL